MAEDEKDFFSFPLFCGLIGFIAAIIIIAVTVFCELFDDPMKIKLFGNVIGLQRIIHGIGIIGLLFTMSAIGFFVGLVCAIAPDSLSIILFILYVIAVAACVIIVVVSALHAISTGVSVALIIIIVILITTTVIVVV